MSSDKNKSNQLDEEKSTSTLLSRRRMLATTTASLGIMGLASTSSVSSAAVAGSNAVLNVKDFGAKGNGNDDDTLSIQSAFNELMLHKGNLVFPAGRYKITGTLYLPEAYKIQISMPYTMDFQGSNSNGTSLVWAGGNNKSMIEIGILASSSLSLNLNNRVNNATGITGIKWSENSGSASNSNYIPYLAISGCDLAMQWGDASNGKNTNIDDNYFDYVAFYDCKNGLLIDSQGQDNNVINYLHDGGVPTNSIKTREYIIRAIRNGNGLIIKNGFIRGDNMLLDSKLIDIQNGSFSCDRMSVESSQSQVLCLYIGSSATRDQSIINNFVVRGGTGGIRDSSGNVMDLRGVSGMILQGCNLGGNIQYSGPLTAINNTLTDGYGFIPVPNTKATLAEINTFHRTEDDAPINIFTSVVKANALIPNSYTSTISAQLYVNLFKASTVFHDVTATNSVTVMAPNNVQQMQDIGREITLILRSKILVECIVTFNNIYKLSGGSYGGPAPNKTDILKFIYDGTVWLEASRSIGISFDRV